MSTYSSSFFCSYVSAGTTLLFTSSSADTFVIRDIEAYNGAGSPQDIVIQTTVSGASIILVKWNAAPALTHQQWEGRIVLPKSVPIAATVETNYVHLVVSGYDLAG